MQIAVREQQVLWYYYWHRLAGCALSWFFWDVSFYGNKLFQSTFIKILYPGASILTTLEWTLLNSSVSLVRTPLPLCPRTSESRSLFKHSSTTHSVMYCLCTKMDSWHEKNQRVA